MGWLSMMTLGRFATPKAYLDDQFTYTSETNTSRVIASALCNMTVYYAAIERVSHETEERMVFAVVCLVRYNRNAKDGYIFAYKDMDETMGPCESQCPPTILDLLTPTEYPYALAWRGRCRAHAQRKARPQPRAGDVVLFAEDLHFGDGFHGRRFRAEKLRSLLILRSLDNGRLYRKPNLAKFDWMLIKAPTAPTASTISAARSAAA